MKAPARAARYDRGRRSDRSTDCRNPRTVAGVVPRDMQASCGWWKPVERHPRGSRSSVDASRPLTVEAARVKVAYCVPGREP